MHNFLDLALLRQAVKGPGIDTRSWVSYGTIAEDSPDSHSVRFKDEEGLPFPEGPLISVLLHPSGIPITCRVAGGVGGIGEADWAPFLQGDEVIIVIPEGNTHAAPVIVGRLNNELDTFPLVVAGQDVTENTFAFRRMRTPFILETSSSYLVRSAVTGAQFGIDQTGQVIFNDGDGSRFFMGADAVGMSTADGSTSMQMLVAEQQIILTAGNVTSFLLDAVSSILTTSGTLSIGTSGLGVMSGLGVVPGGALQHAVTLEQVLSLLINWTILLAGPQGSTTLASELGAAGKLLSTVPSPFPQAFDTALSAMLLLAASPTPSTPTTAGGSYFTWPLTFTPIFGGVSAALAAQASGSSIDPTGFVPGIGRSGFMY